MFDTGHLGRPGPGAGGDEDGLGRHPALTDGDGVRILELGPAFDKVDACAVQHAQIDAVEAVDLAVLVGDQGGPVEARTLDLPAVARGVLDVLGKMGAVGQQLLGHAAADDAGTTDPVFLTDTSAGAVHGSAAAGRDTARAGADDEEIEIVCAHQMPALQRYLTSRNTSMPYFEPSRPTPDSFMMQVPST